MPTLSIWAIRLALVHLVVGWGLGAVLMVNRAWGWSSALWRWVEVHVALALFGWTFLLVVGVAFWMLPTFGRKQGRKKAAATSVVAINAGALAVVVGMVVAGPWAVVAAGLWAVGAVSFGWHAWPRVKAFGA